MTLRVSLLTTGAVAVLAIAVTVGVVLTKSPPAPPDAGGAAVLPPWYATPLKTAPLAAADPDAAGVIAAQSHGQLHRLTPRGDPAGLPQPYVLRWGVSADGRWLAARNCPGGECSLVIGEAGSSWSVEEGGVELHAAFLTGDWAPQATLFAALDTAGNLYLVEPEAGRAGLLKTGVTAYAWAAGDRLVFATYEAGVARLWRAGTSGRWQALGRVEAAVRQLFPSDDGLELAFAQDSEDGWRLMSVRADDGRLRDFGRLGAAAGLSQTKAPAFSIAWSPDRSRVAVGPVTEPFMLHVLSDRGPHYSFPIEKGYAGELRWSPDGGRLAISTYAADRVWHEVFVVEMDALDLGPRFLLDGCEVVWSPDGRYVAVKREPSRAAAVAAINVESGDYWHVSQMPALQPVAWAADGDAAVELALVPARRSGVLGK